MSRPARGFTLMEVLVVISMIGILAAVAAPSFAKMMRDTSVSRVEMQIAEMQRSALVLSSLKTTLVSFRSGASVSFEVREGSLDTDAPRIAGARGCNAIAWVDPARVTSRMFEMKTGGDLAPSDVRFRDESGALRPRVDLCFDRQKVFVRYEEGAFAELGSTLRFEVENRGSGVLRTITIPPSGLPRVSR